jgi:NADH:ubiquinone oxidoreductase subunit 3 (subunit A)
MDSLYTFGMAMLAVGITFRWWSVVLCCALALLFAWAISKNISGNTAWLSYALLLGGLVGGLIWHWGAIRGTQVRSVGDRQKDVGDQEL